MPSDFIATSCRRENVESACSDVEVSAAGHFLADSRQVSVLHEFELQSPYEGGAHHSISVVPFDAFCALLKGLGQSL